jgi:glycosyltransferase involved in cell wall biosynthesis
MKILQVTNSFKYAWDSGGVARGTYEMSKCLAQRGHNITVFTTDRGLPVDITVAKNQPVLMEGMEVYYFKNASKYLADQGLAMPFPALRAIRDKLSRFDIIHVHEYRRILNPVIHRYAIKLGIPYIIQPHGSLTKIMAKPVLTELFDSFWGKVLLKDAAKILVLTEMEAAQCSSMGINEHKIEIVPNGVHLSEYDNLPPKGDFKRKWHIPEGQKVILFLARIHKIKGPDLLAKAFAKISKDTNTLRLAFAGPDGGYLSALKSLVRELGIEEKVLFTGPLCGQDKLEAYIDADVYVLPSIYDTFPNSVLEACACGIPVIVTDRCGMANIIDGQAGLAVPYDENALGKAMLDILDNIEKQRKYAEMGKAIVHEKFTWDKIVENVENTYSECLETKTRYNDPARSA